LHPSTKALILCEELFLIAAFKQSAHSLGRALLIAALKQSAESANYESQGQVPVLQGTSPLVTPENDLERCRRGIGLLREHQLRAIKSSIEVQYSNLIAEAREALRVYETFR
jgi:hypothetical protein